MKRIALLCVVFGVLIGGGAAAFATDSGPISLHPGVGQNSLNAFNYQGDQVLSVSNNGSLSLTDPDSGKTTAGIVATGGLFTAQNFAPDPATVPAGRAFVWFDKTPTTGGLMVTYKDSGGTVKTVKLG